MIENGENQAHLSEQERLGIMKSILRDIIDDVVGIHSDADTNTDERLAAAHRSLEEFVLHMEAAGPSVMLNKYGNTLLNMIKSRAALSPEQLAKYCSQLLGVLDMYSREGDDTKEALLQKLNDRLDMVLIGKGSFENIYELERHLGYMLASEMVEANQEVQALCARIEECIADALEEGSQLKHSRLLLQRTIAATIQNEDD
ncbi:hypothetical protein GF369_04655 [Candidatus Peregrinibacteria bacterium]|nr:hypothetical protein [Candidatus Peregrinibacteria bacterium]